MAKITPIILEDQRNQEGKWNVKIRVGHKSKSAYISTDLFVCQKHLTKDNEIKQGFIVSHLSDVLSSYNEILKRHNHLLRSLTHIQVKDLIEHKSDGYSEEVMFLSFCKQYIDGVKSENSARSLKTTYLRLYDYLGGNDLPAAHITSSFLRQYEEYLRKPTTVVRNRGGKMRELKLVAGNNTTVNGHMRRIKSLHNFAKEKFNDGEIGMVLIPNNPFKKYKIVEPEEPKDRDYSIKQIAMIRDCKVRPGSRAELTRDIFMLSFYLCGMNTADIYRLPAGNFERIDYNRKKTESRRSDKAFISIKLIKEAKPLYAKYAGVIQKKYTKVEGLNHALGMGMRTLRKTLGKGFEELDPYSARHSVASIAANDLGYSVESIGRVLNHGENKRIITNRYIRRTWDIVDKVQADVVGALPPPTY